MSQLKNITIKNYKAFGPEEQTIELRPVTLFIGKNSSGKSSILKLISVLGDLVSGNTLVPMILKNHDVSLGARYEDLFHNNVSMDLYFKLEYASGLEIEASYYIDKGNIYVFNYNLKKGEKIFNVKGDGKPNDQFKGLIYTDALNSFDESAASLSLDVAYIGPFRVLPPRNILSNSPKTKVGFDGKDAYSILLESYLSDDKTLFANVSNWFNEHMDGQKLEFERNSPSSGTYSLYIMHGNAKVNIADVGQGIGQLIPVVTQSFLNNKDNVFIIEQPALHLHPASHASIAYLIAETAKQFNRQCIIETHSENILLAIRNAVVRKDLKLESTDVAIYYIDSDGDESFIQKIEIDKDGHLSSWPTGIFSESFDLLGEIKKNSEYDSEN